MEDAQNYLPVILKKRGIPYEPALGVLTKLKFLLNIVDQKIYQSYAEEAQQRIKSRDIEDWPIVATALALHSPIWTEDQDFFGSGIAVWTTDRIHLFFELISTKQNLISDILL